MKFALFLAAALVACNVCAGDAPELGDSMCLSGTVVETKDVDSYTYLLLKTGNGETWAAIDKAPVSVGAKVAVEQAAVMKDFWSRTLERQFDWIVFGRLAESCAPQAPPGFAIAAHHAAAPAPPTDVTPIRVPKADGPDGRTVAEAVGGSAALADHQVTIRGQIVKYVPEVMGKNWIHLRDGSGSPADGTDDVVVTTATQAKIGEVVLVRGVLHTNRDFGVGYAYKVLIEDATLER